MVGVGLYRIAAVDASPMITKTVRRISLKDLG